MDSGRPRIERPFHLPFAGEDERVRESAAHYESLRAQVAELYVAHAAGLERYACTVTHSMDLAEEAVHEAFLRLFVALRRSMPVANPKAFLYRVLHNHLLDQVRRAETHPEVSSDLAASEKDQRLSPEENIEFAQAVDHILGLLTKREAQIVLLRAEGLSYPEIADMLQIRIGSVGSFLSRAAWKLRKFAR